MGLGLVFAGIGAIAAVWASAVAQQQLVISRDTEKRQLRAYIYTVPAIANLAPGQRPIVSITVKNGGLTPAYNINAALNALVLEHPQKGPISRIGAKPDPTHPTPDGVGAFVFQDHDMELVLPPAATPTIGPDIFQSIIDGTQKRLYVWGRLQYLDAFHEQHYLNFCFTIDGESVKLGKVHHCPDYNDAD